MKLSQNNDMQLKKRALRSMMREEWKQSYFSSVRKSIICNQQLIEQYKQRVQTIIDELPATLGQLATEMDNQFQTIYRMLVEQIDTIADRLVRMQMCDWKQYISIINRLLSNPRCQKDVDRVIAHTFLPLMECAQILAEKYKRQRIIYQNIMELCLEYCFRLGQRLLKLDQLQEGALQTILCRLWSYQQQQSMFDMKDYDQQYHSEDSDEGSDDSEQECDNKEMKLVQLTNNIISAQFDSDEEQNVTPGEQRDLQMMKTFLIQKVFYKTGMRLSLLVQRCFKHSQKRKSKKTLKLYIKLLVNITVYINKSAFYLPLIDAHILLLLNKLFQSNFQSDMLILAVKLLNNMLVNQQKLTQMILKEVMLTLLINLYGCHQNWELQCQIGQLFSNLIHFMNHDSQLVRSLINLEVDQLLCSRFDYYQHATQSQISQILCSIVIMMNNHPYRLNQLLRRQQTKLKIIMQEKGAFCAAMIDQILKGIYEQTNL